MLFDKHAKTDQYRHGYTWNDRERQGKTGKDRERQGKTGKDIGRHSGHSKVWTQHVRMWSDIEKRRNINMKKL